MKENSEYQEIKYTITRLLARREHSQYELIFKMEQRKFNSELVTQWLNKFSESDIQSDERFAEMLARSRVRRGAGELSLKNEFKYHRIDHEIVSRVLLNLEVDWFEHAVKVLAKKKGHSDLNDPKLYQKHYRFMLQRGFSPEQIQYAMGQLKL